MIIQIIYYTFALLHTRLKNKIIHSNGRYTALNVEWVIKPCYVAITFETLGAFLCSAPVELFS